MTKLNPFLTSGYISSEYFCNREEETKRLANGLLNGRNITLTALRRIGKTALIRHTFEMFKKEDVYSLHVDILQALTFPDLVRLLGEAVANDLEKPGTKVFSRITKALSMLRPTLSVDQFSGMPKIDITLQEDQEEKSIGQIFEYIDSLKKRVIIAIDEFQQICNFPQRNTEAILRKYTQQSKNTSFVYSGSQTHLLTLMFSGEGRPFYQSTEFMALEKIDKSAYKEFISCHFKKGGRKISDKSIDLILKWTNIHTFYTQYVCNRLYGNNITNIGISDIQGLFSAILKENELNFLTYRQLLSSYQFKLLKAIAMQEGVHHPTSKDFIYDYRLNTPSSVKTALDKLVNKDIVYQDRGAYHVNDVFLAHWLRKSPGK
ncbi:MAG: AAA family ATPase [bacterium]